jgi:hypothetical protein
VEIYAGENTYTVLVGKSVSNRKGQYIRLFQHASEADQVWLADKELDSSADPVDWLRDEVIDIEANRVQKVLFATGEDRLEAVRKDADLELVDLPEDAELSYPTIVETLARALVNVRLQDVIPVEQIDFNAASKATFSLDDDTEINVELVEADEKRWLRLIDHSSSKWAFEVSSLVFDNLTKGLEDLLKQDESDT